MSDGMDMSSPVTRGEFEQRLALLATKDDLKFGLETWGGALLARIETGEQRLVGRLEAMDQRLSARMEAMDQRLSARMEAVTEHLTQAMTQMEQRLLDEIGRHTRAAQEAAQMQITVLDDKYGDLPRRVKRLETKVFPPPRR